jgi:hypothetical protein
VHAQAAPPPLLLYQANPQTYNWTVNGRTYRNNKNPFGFELYGCVNLSNGTFEGGEARRDACIPSATTINGNKWWSSSVQTTGGACIFSQPDYDGPPQSQDTRRMNGTNNTNAHTQICSTIWGQDSQYPFINVSKQITYDSSYCSKGDAMIVSARSDPSNPVCQDLDVVDMLTNPANYSQNQRSCLRFIDDIAYLQACKNGICKTHSLTRPPKAVPGRHPDPGLLYDNVCDIFTQGNGTYALRLQAFDQHQQQYGSSSFWLSLLSYGTPHTISGQIFNDTNKNRIKDAGETDYGGPITITSSTGTVTTTGGSYTISGIPSGNATISFPSLPSGYQMIYPRNGPPPSFSATVGPGCTVDNTTGGTCNAGDITNLNFAISNSTPWMQSYDLDVRFDNGYTNIIPQTPLYPPYASVQSVLSSTPGIIFSGDGTASFGQGQASSANWLIGGTVYPEVFPASTTNQLQSSYQYLVDTTKSAAITPTDLTSLATCRNLSNCTLPATLPNGVYQANGDTTLNAYTVAANKDYVFLINGTVTINGTITVPNTSTALFAADKDIIIPSTVGAPATFPLPQAQLQGFYSAGKNFTIQGINNCLTGADRMLVVAGAIVVNANGAGGDLINQRDLCGNNPHYPAFSIQARPDFILNAPSFLMKQNTSFREEAP